MRRRWPSTNKNASGRSRAAARAISLAPECGEGLPSTTTTSPTAFRGLACLSLPYVLMLALPNTFKCVASSSRLGAPRCARAIQSAAVRQRVLPPASLHDSPTPAEIAPLLDEYARHSPRPLTLSTLLSFGRPVTPESVLTSVEYVLSEVPRMFGWRVRALEELPFIVGMNPFISRILAAHRKSFKTIASYPPIKTLEDNARFTEQLEALVLSHSNDIPIMAKG